MSYDNHTSRGFTFLEVLLTVAVLGIITGVGIPVYQSLQNRNELDIATTHTTQTLRRAQALTVASDGDSSWGMYATTSQIVLFKGDSYATRSSDFDEVAYIPSNIGIAGVYEVVFDRVTGETSTTGTMTLTGLNAIERTITINEKGTVTY